jgi:hypothetical protein
MNHNHPSSSVVASHPDAGGGRVHSHNHHGSRFVTLQQVFHPEDAEETLTRRKQRISAARNKWGVVWAEATLVPENNHTTTGSSGSSFEPQEAEVVIIQQMAIESFDELEQQQQQQQISLPAEKQISKASSTSKASAHSHRSSYSPRSAPFYEGHFFDNLFGLCMALAAVSATFSIDLCAAIIYVLAAGFYKTAELCKESSIFLLPFYGIFHFVYSVLTFVDAILLALSVFMSELLAGIGWALTVCAGGFQKGMDWHQYIRKLCHLTRWAFRGFHSEWTPKRVFPWSPKRPVDADDDKYVNAKQFHAAKTSDNTISVQNVESI